MEVPPRQLRWPQESPKTAQICILKIVYEAAKTPPKHPLGKPEEAKTIDVPLVVEKLLHVLFAPLACAWATWDTRVPEALLDFKRAKRAWF
eukprot:176667-Pyramimonas_sp.AAC.1